jgi:hypothetical protein
MALKILLLALTGLIIPNSIYISLRETFHRRRILEATVMITMTAPELEEAPVFDEALPIPPDEYRPIVKPDSYKVAEGLGTLVNSGDEIWLVTHDHWSLLDKSLGTVQISDADGERLVEIQLMHFKKLIHYRDGGTMILEAPKEIKTKGQFKISWLPGNWPGYQESSPGDVVLLAHRQRDGVRGISIMEARVEKTGARQGSPVIRLQSSNGESIVGGDSGGGVWLQGKLVGNLWSTVMMEDRQTGSRQQTETSIAALYPQTFDAK